VANNVLTWAYKIQRLKPLEKFLLVTLADQSNKDGGCYPGVQSLAEDMCLSDRHIRRLMRKLETYGLVVSSQRYRVNRSFSSKLYQLATAIEPTDWFPEGSSKTAIMSTSAVSAFRELLQKRIEEMAAAAGNSGTQTFQIWLLPMQLITIDRNRLVIKVPNPLFIDKIQKDFSSIILQVAQTTIDANIRKIHLIHKT
jgi:DNA-binding IscR family transcriptional regulator